MIVLHVDIGGCEGCSISIFRASSMLKDVEIINKCTAEREVDLSRNYEIVFVTGSVCINDEDVVEKLKLVRKNCKVLIAFGSCASVGGITRFCRGGQEPKPEHRTFLPLNSVVKVDYAIPGCPPPPQLVRMFLTLYKRNMLQQLAVFKALSTIKKLSGFDLLDDVVLTGLCIGCGACELSCPTGAIKLLGGRPDLIVEKCIRCGTCYVRCPQGSKLLFRSLKANVNKHKA